jgi:hypothetical protein
MRQVYINEDWVVDTYLMMEKEKKWKDLDNIDDMKVLELEQELLAETEGVDIESLPSIVVD